MHIERDFHGQLSVQFSQVAGCCISVERQWSSFEVNRGKNVHY